MISCSPGRRRIFFSAVEFLGVADVVAVDPDAGVAIDLLGALEDDFAHDFVARSGGSFLRADGSDYEEKQGG
jgi:hypothetical protein